MDIAEFLMPTKRKISLFFISSIILIVPLILFYLFQLIGILPKSGPPNIFALFIAPIAAVYYIILLTPLEIFRFPIFIKQCEFLCTPSTEGIIFLIIIWIIIIYLISCSIRRKS